MQKIFDPRGHGKMKVAVFFSGGASSFRAMLDDPEYGRLYEVVAGVTNKDGTSGTPHFTSRGIEVLHYPLNFPAFDADAAAPMYEEVLRGLDGFGPDLIALSGFMRIVAYPLIERKGEQGRFSGRVLNVHPADLSILSGPGIERLYAGGLDPEQVAELVAANSLGRRYTGEDAVYDAIASGEKEARSTVHMATEAFDQGPILVQSKPFPVEDKVGRWVGARNFRNVRQYADELQERMKREGDGPAYVNALGMISRGELGLDGCSVYRAADGGNIRLPYHGIRLE